MDKKISLFRQIQEDIKRQIFSGKLQVGDKLPSEMKLCEVYGVSRITAKRAIDELAAEGLVKRVKGSGSYVASDYKAPRALGSERMFSFVIPFDISTGRGIDMVAGANDFLQQNNCILNILNTMQDEQREREILLEVLEGDTCGAIYYPISRFANWDLLITANAQNFPLVTVDKIAEQEVFGGVVSDNYAGAYNAVCRLIELGHERIGFLSDIANSIEERFYGYCAAMRDHGKGFDTGCYRIGFLEDAKQANKDVYRIMLERNKPFGLECIEFFKPILAKLLDGPRPVSAVLAINDYVGMYVLKTAQAMGVRVPQDLSVIGFDNLEFSQHLEVPLATVEQNFYKIGWEAAKLLFDNMMGAESAGRKITIPVKYIERGSVARIPVKT